MSGNHKRHANPFFTIQATKENHHGRRHAAIYVDMLYVNVYFAGRVFSSLNTLFYLSIAHGLLRDTYDWATNERKQKTYRSHFVTTLITQPQHRVILKRLAHTNETLSQLSDIKSTYQHRKTDTGTLIKGHDGNQHADQRLHPLGYSSN